MKNIVILILFTSQNIFADNYLDNFNSTKKNINNYNGIERVKKYNELNIFTLYYSHNIQEALTFQKEALSYAQNLNDFEAVNLAKLIGINYNYRPESKTQKLAIVLEILDEAIITDNFYIISQCYVFLYYYYDNINNDLANKYYKALEKLVSTTDINCLNFYVIKLFNNNFDNLSYIIDKINNNSKNKFDQFFFKINYDYYRFKYNINTNSEFKKYQFFTANYNYNQNLKNCKNISDNELLNYKNIAINPKEIEMYYVLFFQNQILKNEYQKAKEAFEKIKTLFTLIPKDSVDKLLELAKLNKDNDVIIYIYEMQKINNENIKIDPDIFSNKIITQYYKSNATQYLFYINIILAILFIGFFIKNIRSILNIKKKSFK
jgi:hypothetical protein